MKKIFLFLTVASLCFGGSISNSYAQWDDSWDDAQIDAAFEQGEFEGAFEACFEYDLLEDDKQCECIFKVARSVLSPEEYSQAMSLKEAGRTGSANKIFKKALKEAYSKCY